MTSHTPGPWRNGKDGHNILSAQPGERPKMLASVYHDLGGVGGLTSKEHAEAHANARLMAAAPDLLAACRAQHRNIATLLKLIDESDQWADLASMSALGDIANAMRADEAAVNAAIAQAEKGTDR